MKEDEENIRTAVIKLDQSEIAIRIIEGMTETDRPRGKNPQELLESLDASSRDKALAAATLVAEYFLECLREGIPATELIRKSRIN